jgi:hypothetical protein
MVPKMTTASNLKDRKLLHFGSLRLKHAECVPSLKAKFCSGICGEAAKGQKEGQASR